MTDLTHTPEMALKRLKWPLRLTLWGMLAERATRAFWPLWSIVFAALVPLLFGWHDSAGRGAVIAAAAAVGLAALWALIAGLRGFRFPARAEALARLDATLPGRPITALSDAQAIGAGDAGSEYVWRAHVARMAERVQMARAVSPDLRLSARDRYGLRYVAVIGLAVALIFGSLWRVGTVGDSLGAPGAALAGGPAWEGWVEPPAYTGKPGLYLNDIAQARLRVPQGSRVTLRLYGQPGALEIRETVSGAPLPPGEDAMTRRFDVAQSGALEIAGPGGQAWDVVMEPDRPPTVTIAARMERGRGGEIQQKFLARDDHGVVAGRVTISLDLAAVDRRYGLAAVPEPRAAIVVDLPMPITGDRTGFEETLVENFSQHPWARLPVEMLFEVEDALGQTGQSSPIKSDLGGRRFFDPMAAALIEMRRDLLWTRANAPRVVQVLRALTHRPDEVFRNGAAYLPLRVAMRRLAVVQDDLDAGTRDEIAQVLWDIAVMLEDGGLSDALARLNRAQDRLSEAMRRGADEAEIAELMEELQQAMRDYIRQLAEQSQQEGQQTDQAENQNMQEITPDQLQQMLDRIQELMEQGRMAEAQQLLDQLRQMMENMQVTQGQGQGQRSPGQQAMEGLAETLRDQQGLSDDAFRELQEQFNPGADAGQNEGQDGLGQAPGGQGQAEGQQRPGAGGQPGDQSLADRQRALRRELDRQQRQLPGLGGEAGRAARDALDRAGRAMDGAEEALRGDDIAGALDNQAEAMEALREGMRNLGEALAEQQGQPGQQGQQGDATGQARSDAQRDPLGRERGAQGPLGTDENLLQGEDVYGRARELLDEIRRRSSEQGRPEIELDYLRRLLDRF
ncbi:TIGR02302 family protein [Actibacterium sp. MT2.3-13A]|uniref:TIGR02302 family protein n=1 Tax=Actibacterium sp. MT2.3-13A TaxID=2828332 RepID=UPI001BA70002|nr:TIGR02302 family protein [Actibacterium sp. MT2.3-13A]